ncbi:hypothetical protein [Reyranella sp. CPCC 100927]|uniref:hypothetical protein n=1 Tax=Reyranella sp. CPCC 100927 TaxID=2599616 RepID=UPI0011B71B83|nr:hypothetical protein [Reyranella sp. CPCC 100927]TWS97084.1 hypothetical protein FQU96_38100 [Reyranella sp. CPCC 100927]
MVVSSCYGITPGSTNWGQPQQGSANGDREHAEREAYAHYTGHRGDRNFRGLSVFLFVQDAYPCRECDTFFRAQSATKSFVFRITRNTAGYGPPTPLLERRPRPAMGNDPAAYHAAMQAFKNAAPFVQVANLGAVQTPAVLYYHRGSAYLNVTPDGFPAHPDISRF